MQFPSKDDYLKAVQHHESFPDADLRRAEFLRDPLWKVPRPAAGASAVVFKARVDGDLQALRFFLRAEASTQAHYDALGAHVSRHRLQDCVAAARWIDAGIKISGRTWPAVRMQWISGHTLYRHVEQLVYHGDTAALNRLATAWLTLVQRLQSAQFAHGDLQHGNVLVDERGALRLVDLDCTWIDAFAGQTPPTETGHPNYQPEHRPWGRWMDTFPGLVVYASLLALSAEPRAWDALNTGDNLVFTRDDFVPPFRTEAWQRLAAIGNPELRRVMTAIQQLCRAGVGAGGSVDDVLRPVPGPGPQAPGPKVVMPRPRPRPWWEETRARAGTAGARPSAGPSRPQGAGAGPGPSGARPGPSAARPGPAGARPGPSGATGSSPRPGASATGGTRPEWWTRLPSAAASAPGGPQPGAGQRPTQSTPPTGSPQANPVKQQPVTKRGRGGKAAGAGLFVGLVVIMFTMPIAAANGAPPVIGLVVGLIAGFVTVLLALSLR
jgi:eukaryotic-like serine/threonine-protein kinase